MIKLRRTKIKLAVVGDKEKTNSISEGGWVDLQFYLHHLNYLWTRFRGICTCIS